MCDNIGRLQLQDYNCCLGKKNKKTFRMLAEKHFFKSTSCHGSLSIPLESTIGSIHLRPMYRNSHRRSSVKKGFLKHFAESLNVFKKRLQNRCFPVNVAKCLKTFFFFTEHLRWLLLYIGLKWIEL